MSPSPSSGNETFIARILIQGSTVLQISLQVEALGIYCPLLQGHFMFLTCFFISFVSGVSTWRFLLTNADNFTG